MREVAIQQVKLRTVRQKKIPYGIDAHCGFGAPQSTQSIRNNSTLALVPLIADGVGRAGPNENCTHSYYPNLPVS
jgi:hypothetical protein